jgi:pimeloyl-ACP methyl ester carboxylesterase
MKSTFMRALLLIAAGAVVASVAWHLVSAHYGEAEKALRSHMRETVKETFPDRSAAYMKTFGLFSAKDNRAISKDTIGSDTGIVLVHGLDDPGKVWQDLAPALRNQGHEVWLMNYPNDQPVAESADLLFAALRKIRSLGVKHISIVAHSMGGLVSREMLTRPDLNYRVARQNGQVPRVDKLIMVGTPNHGSHMARLRFLGEVRDHFVRLSNGEAAWLGMILDGAGEAKIDLLPGSRFLTELNARPHPQGVQQSIIAGIISPWTEADIRQWREEVEKRLPNHRSTQFDTLSRQMVAMSHGLGDGLVTLESTRLDGIPHRTVEGTHLTMIRNLTTDSQRVPPAVPVIIDQLAQSTQR